MLSVFPDALSFGFLAPTLIRIALALIFGYAAWQHCKAPGVALRTLSAGESVATLGLFLGLWTQPAALLGAIISAIWFFQPSTRMHALSSILLAFVLCFCLILTGAGAFAFDLPL